jgi:tetratricopeptide (TPR) repeat protein
MTRRIAALLLIALVGVLPLPVYAANLSAVLQLLSAGHADEAVAALRLQLQAAPQDAAAHALLMRAYFATQQWDDAIAEGRRAVALDPQNSQYHLWLGRAYGEKAEHSLWVMAVGLARKTRIEFETAVALDRNNLEAHSDLAEFYVQAPAFLGGGTDKAQTQADQIRALGDETSALGISAQIAEAAKNYALAEQKLRQAIRVSHDNPNAILNLANFLQRRGRMTEVEATVNRAFLAATGSEPGYIFLEGAQSLYLAGRNFNGAMQMLRTYINSSQHSENAPLFQAYYLLGSILEKAGDKGGAAQQYRAALALASSFEPAQTALKRVK